MKNFMEASSGKEVYRLRSANSASNFSYFLPIIFIFGSFLLYLPVINRYFVSDDFKVLNRVCNHHIIFIKGFFRPLSDLSIFLNYQLNGLNPVVFNSFNILLHGINSYLLYLICICLGSNKEKFKVIYFAWISSAFFLTYPFHNEAIVWLLCRGASMACLFSLLAILGFYKIKNTNLRFLFVCASYFISISAFESTLFFPIIFLLLALLENQPFSSLKKWIVFLGLTCILHLFLRIFISGSVTGSYGWEFFHSGMRFYIFNIGKVGGRLLLPPLKNANILSAAFLAIIILFGSLIFKNYKKNRLAPERRTSLFLGSMLFIACIIPVLTGISTQTSETDRTLYFPSVFLCMITGYYLTFQVKNFNFKLIITLMIIAYNIFFLEVNNRNWIKASSITHSIMNTIRSENSTDRVFFLNIPNEIQGAYVLRQGFQDALKLYGADSSLNIDVNYLPRQDLEKMKAQIKLNLQDEIINLPPDIILKSDSAGCRKIFDHGVLKYTCMAGDHIYFWNINQLELIPACK